nr:retrovirus-related Pol polyprotein from transposon TNT 1-94 [Tanacetum cinerariifolium]
MVPLKISALFVQLSLTSGFVFRQRHSVVECTQLEFGVRSRHLHIRDGENLDMMKEKRDPYILASDYDNSDPVPQLQNVSSSADAHVPSQQELDLLFGPLYDEFFTAGTSSVNKSSSPINNSNQQDTQPTMNIQPTSEPSTHTYVHAEENNDNQAEEEHLLKDEFTNPFCTPTKDHPLEQIRGNPSKPVQTRRQLATDPEMYMFALTVCTAKPKNIKKALYGLKQAPRAWYDKLLKFLTSKGFTKGSTNPKFSKRVEKLMHGRFEMSLMGEMKFFLGLQIHQSPCDADHAGCIDTHKSTSRGIQFLGDKLVSWMLKKQDCTAMSSAEAQYVALSASCAQVMWMRTQLQDYGLNYNKILLYCDSQSAIAISCNPVQHSRTKHIHTRYHFIKEHVENGIIELYFVRTEYHLADMFTKALPEDRFKYLIRRIGMRCLTLAELEVLAKESA